MASRSLRLSFCLLLVSSGRAALNVGTEAASELVAGLRQSIFIEGSLLEERRDERCSSLDGPRCFQFLASAGREREDPLLAGAASEGPGVLPARLLQELGRLGASPGDVEYDMPDFNVLEHYRRQAAATVKQQLLPALAGTQEAGGPLLRPSGGESASGVLHFAELMAERRLPLTFSRGLPDRVIATWDGRWLVRDCPSSASRSSSGDRGRRLLLAPPSQGILALPPPTAETNDGAMVVVATVGGGKAQRGELEAGAATSGGREVSASVELLGSLGYLRFSRPVMVRSLFARWPARADAPPAVVGGRLGLTPAWTTHLHPSMFPSDGWLDISGDPLQPVDEVAFVAATGLEIGAVEVVAPLAGGEEADDRSVLLLSPLPADALDVSAAGASGERPRFALKLQQLSPAAAPYVVSLAEAIQRNLKLKAGPGALPAKPDIRDVAWPRASALPAAPAAGQAAQGAAAVASSEEIWPIVARTNQEMFDHQLIQKFPALIARELGAPSSALPADLRKELLQERDSILEALAGWLSGSSGDRSLDGTLRGGTAIGGWHRNTPTEFPQKGSDVALLKYMTAKRWQSKLDYLTAAFLHLHSDDVEREAVEMALQVKAMQEALQAGLRTRAADA